MKKVYVAILVLTFNTLAASAQWLTSGTNIYNSNSGNVGIGTTTPAYKFTLANPAQTSSMTASVNTIQTQPNSGEMGDGALQLSYKLSASSTTNELVTRVFQLGSTNNLTGGGAINYMRVLNIANTTNTGTTTNDLDAIFIENGISTGTVLNNRAIRVNNMQGTNQAGIAIAAMGGTSHTYALFGSTEIPFGNFGIYSAFPADRNYFAGNTSIGSPTTTSMFNVGSAGQFQVSSLGAIAATTGITSSGSYIQSGVATNTFTGPATFANATNSALFTGGTVGIGITTPNTGAKLDVNGNIYCRSTLYVGVPDATTAAQYSGYGLAVNGTAIFNKAKVKLYGNWPDYVFDEKYNLLPLPELEQFLNKNKHLPDVPSAAEVAKDGIDLGDNQARLLKKLEELTLYMIEQNKRLEAQGGEISDLKKQLLILQKK